MLNQNILEHNIQYMQNQSRIDQLGIHKIYLLDYKIFRQSMLCTLTNLYPNMYHYCTQRISSHQILASRLDRQHKIFEQYHKFDFEGS